MGGDPARGLDSAPRAVYRFRVIIPPPVRTTPTVSSLPPFLDLPPETRPPRPPPRVRSAVLLALLFGPLGLFYASPIGGVLMTFVTAVAGLSTVGVGLLFAWPVCIVWAYIAASSQHEESPGAAAPAGGGGGGPPARR